ncbi:MAG: CBS domain-containing protein [Deltaproteobacteria bacterium]
MNEAISSAVQKGGPTVSLDDSLRTAIGKMAEAKATGLVVKSGGQVVGIITTLDLMRSVVNKEDLDETKVSQFMTACELIGAKATKSPCVQVDENESVAMALEVMDQAGVHNLLVSGGSGDAIGMVSAQELLKLAIS